MDSLTLCKCPEAAVATNITITGTQEASTVTKINSQTDGSMIKP